ncbi:MAG TPA: trans-aconitate methyltransferase, partial [Acetobacteraceae bacterium]|nr:trans-aconitate methyltransferase [Acetobacteraceae bacterium]
PAEYWDLLRPHAAKLDLWETIYLHALTGPDAVLQWAMGTSLRPYLDALAEPERSAFREAYAAALRPHYPPRPDGTTLFPFRRLFLLATAPG